MLPNKPPSKLPNHPAGTVGLVLSACSLVPLPIIGGLVGSIVGAAGVRAARREPQRWSNGTGIAAVGVGLVLGTLPMLVFGIVKADDWTWIPFALALLQAGIVAGLAAGARHAVPGAAGALAGAGLAIGLVLGLVAFFVLLGELFWEAIFSGD